MPDIREVAEQAGVSPATVSNVLNRPEIVSEATRLRVHAAIEALGFIRNGSAHQLRAGHSKHLGLIVMDVTNPFFTEVARGVEDAANEAGYVVILCNSDNTPEKEQRYLYMLQEQRTGGILITPVQGDIAYLEQLRQQKMAVVLLDRPGDSQKLCSVAIDDVLGGELALRHLLDLGHRRIAFVSAPLDLCQYAERHRGAQRAIQRTGLDSADVLCEIGVPVPNVIEGEQCVETILSIADRPTAIFCVNDFLALGVMRGLSLRGIPIPQEMAVIGYDDILFAGMLSPALTSIRQPTYQLGRSAAELLLREMSDVENHQHTQIVYQPELIVRASTVPRPA